MRWFSSGAAESLVRLNRRVGCRRALVVSALALGALFQALAFFQEPEARAVALGYFACGATTLVAWLGRRRLRRFGRPQAPGAGRRFVLLGSLGAAWVEIVFWAAEKLTGATDVAASANLLADLLITMPWYVAMLAVLWAIQRRFRYHWTTVALLGGLYEMGADGVLGNLANGVALTPALLAMLTLFYWVFVVVYAPIVLPPVWALRPGRGDARSEGGCLRALAALAPLLPLVPYGLLVIVLRYHLNKPG